MIELKIDGIRELERCWTEKEVIVTAEILPSVISAATNILCPHCLKTSPRAVRVHHEQQDFLDLPEDGRQTILRLLRPRVLCKHCGVLHPFGIAELNERFKWTERFIKRVFECSLGSRFALFGPQLLLTQERVKEVLTYQMERLALEKRARVLDSLGFEFIYARRKPLVLIIDTAAGQVIDALPSSGHSSFQSLLESGLLGQAPMTVRMDAFFPFRQTVHRMMPDAVHIVDRFHIDRIATYCVDAVHRLETSRTAAKANHHGMDRQTRIYQRRSELTKRDRIALAHWAAHMPLLLAAYEAKEDLLAAFDAARSSAAAKACYADWFSSLSHGMVADCFGPLTRAIETNGPAFFRYFDLKQDTYEDLLNSIMTTTVRAGIDYEVEALGPKLVNARAGGDPVQTSQELGGTSSYACLVRKILANSLVGVLAAMPTAATSLR